MRFETTVQRPVEATGVGLHSGVPVRIRILPAPVSTGIVFLRTDLDNFPIPASWRHVARVSYATSLMRQGVLISTTEHLLSVFYSMGIDNAYHRDRQPGSAHPGWQRPALRATDSGSRHPAVPPQAPVPAHPPPHFGGGQRQAHQHPSGRKFPPDLRYRLPAPVGRQSLELEVTPERYASQLAFARTFGWEHDLDQMRNMGLIRGASLENAVCFTKAGVLNPEGLRAPTMSAAATKRWT